MKELSNAMTVEFKPQLKLDLLKLIILQKYYTMKAF